MPFNIQSWTQILDTEWDWNIDPVEEASSGTSLVPPLDRKWLSDDELPPSATNDDPDPDPPSQPISTSVPPEPPPPQSPRTGKKSSKTEEITL
jgi:hypothetical protein